jgi:eukaryotic-like serine/threonine-protein kinase
VGLLLISTQLQFQKKKDIGQQEGANSKVFIAYDPQLNADVVIKQIKKETMKVDEYFKEAHILYNHPHPNITEVNYASFQDEYVYISMPYYKNGSINSLINKRFLTVREIIKYSLDFLLGLHYIHTQGLIHFDVKPTNILINDSDRAMLTDFGLAKYVDAYATAVPDKMYTVQMAPEYILQEDLTLHHDIYQAGVTLYRMCNGNKHFYSQVQQLSDLEKAIVEGKFPNRNAYLPHIPKQLIKIINKMLSVDPDDRPKNLLEVVNALSKIDKNLDWQYNIDNNTRTEVWSLEKEKTIERIILSYDGNKWAIKGQKFLKSSGKTKNVRKWEKSNIKSHDIAYTIVAKFISDYN